MYFDEEKKFIGAFPTVNLKSNLKIVSRKEYKVNKVDLSAKQEIFRGENKLGLKIWVKVNNKVNHVQTRLRSRSRGAKSRSISRSARSRSLSTILLSYIYALPLYGG